MCAGVAQLVEQLTCNQPVGGSTPLASSIFIECFKDVPSLSRKTIHCCMTQKVTTLWGRALSRCMRSNILRIVLVLIRF